ncbi:probable G-protein coupled receptor B0563.6 [Copidosoma floridanum]|uniref:probable G-protein coupled receptor B0563.6 n=1 Tax=Copidosoma floridanum TaxID=29053 RepID=UPI0006C96925|nr:probable G-protein coupled receptor B0563.6 [Copidosoma floridanum]
MNDSEESANKSAYWQDFCVPRSEIRRYEDPRIPDLRNVTYGIVIPVICFFGIFGNVLNLIVLTRRNMQGTAYIYMRGYSTASLLALAICISFTLRVLTHRDNLGWSSWLQAFYHVHLELYLGNSCLGVSVMMLSALTLERHASVCQPRKHRRPVCGPPRWTVLVLPLATFLLYVPYAFKAKIQRCLLAKAVLYRRRENSDLLRSLVYKVYRVLLETGFKVGPTVLLAVLNLRIVLAYRRTCERRRRLTRRSARDARSVSEERRLVMLLGSTSLLFLVCVSPMVILDLTLNEANLSIFSYQVFRATANLLEVVNYSLTFYIYCLFSEDFRATLLRTFKWPDRSLGSGSNSPSPEYIANTPPPLSPRRG